MHWSSCSQRTCSLSLTHTNPTLLLVVCTSMVLRKVVLSYSRVHVQCTSRTTVRCTISYPHQLHNTCVVFILHVWYYCMHSIYTTSVASTSESEKVPRYLARTLFASLHHFILWKEYIISAASEHRLNYKVPQHENNLHSCRRRHSVLCLPCVRFRSLLCRVSPRRLTARRLPSPDGEGIREEN